MYLSQLVKATAIAIALAAASPALAQSHYTSVRAQIDLDEVPYVHVIDSKIDTSFAQVGTAADIYAKARSSFGNNGAYAVANKQSANLGAYAESIWVDAFIVTGGVGAGTLDISVWVNGTMDGAGQPGGPGSNSFYQLYVSNAPISCNFDAFGCTGTHLISPVEGINGSKLLTKQLSFNYGETFYLASYLGAEVLGNGFSDFYGSAHFGATAPGSASITGSSGMTYALASSVPEPTSEALFFAGLVLLGFARRKGLRLSVKNRSEAMKLPVLLAAIAATYCIPSWADTYSFAAVKDAGVNASDVASAQYGYTDKAFLDNTGLAVASGVGNAAKAQTLLGVNRIEVSNSIPVSDEFIRSTGIGGPFAIGLSGWTDDFVITGATGSGTALISVNVTGSFGMGFGSGGGYGLWLSTPDELRNEVTEFLRTDPTAWVLETIDEPEDGGEILKISYLANVLKPGYTDPGLALAPGSQFGGIFTTEIQFNYGESFSIASVLFGFANDSGSLSAMNSAHFGISVLNNTDATVATSSGMTYAAAVPEPLTQAMLLSGLAVLAFTVWRNRRPQA